MSEKILFDTDILIWYFRGLEAAALAISKIPFEQRCISSLCVMELIQGCRNKKELKDTTAFVKYTFGDVIHCDRVVSEKAITLLKTHGLSDGLRTVDALIAATAIVQEATLATGNFRHFEAIKGLNLMKFEPHSR